MPGAGDVLPAIQEKRVGPVPVAPGAADLLVERFRAVRHVQVHHEAHIRPVDPHAERDGRHHDDRFPAAEPGQRHPLLHGRQPGVERQRREPVRLEPERRPLGLVAAAAIHDPGLPFVAVQECRQLLRLALLCLRRDVQVGAVEAGGEHLRLFHAQRVQDVEAGARVGRCGERDARHAGKALSDPGEAAVFRAELVPPGRNAMRLVDGEEGDALPGQAVERARHRKPLRRHVQQVEPARIEFDGDRPRRIRLDFGVQRPGRDAELPQRRDLVVHQRDERRHDDGRAGPAQCRHLVAQALAAPGRHQHQRVAPGHHPLDRRLLQPAEGRETEHAAQHVARRDPTFCNALRRHRGP